jgi:hypothetical protein
MPDRIIHLRSLTPGAAPTTASFGVGEFAINVPDGKIYFRKSGSNNNTVETAITTNAYNAGNVTISGSLNFTGSIYQSGSSTLFGNMRLSGSVSISGSSTQFGNNTIVGDASVSGSLTVSLGVTASLYGNANTATTASNADTASYVDYANVKNISSTSIFAGTASYAVGAQASLPSGSTYNITSSWAITASYAASADASLPSGSYYNITSSWSSNSITSSYSIQANSASYSTQTLSSSYAISSSISLIADTASYVPWANVDESTTDIFVGTASYSSLSKTSSYVAWANVDEATTDLFLGTASYAAKAATASWYQLPNNLVSSSAQLENNGGVAFTNTSKVTFGQITASNAQIINLSVQYITSSVIITTGSNKFGDSESDKQEFTGSVEITGSLTVNGPIQGTASYSSEALSASYAIRSSTASFAENIATGLKITSSAILSTGSNSFGSVTSDIHKFTGSIYLSGSIFVNGTEFVSGGETSNITGSLFGTASWARNLVAGTKITSSGILSTGSNTFGSVPADIHRFTGSIYLSGSIFVNGTEFVSGGETSNITGSLFGTASWARNLVAGTKITASGILSTGSNTFGSVQADIHRFTGSIYLSGSIVVNGNEFVTGAETSNITGSLFGTASWARNLVAGTKVTASGILSTGSNVFGSIVTDSHRFTGSVSISGSLIVNGTEVANVTGSLFGTASWAINAINIASSSKISVAAITASVVYGSGSNVFGTKQTDSHRFTGSIYLSGSIIINGNEFVSGTETAVNATGSLFGTASYAISASYVKNSETASYAFVSGSQNYLPKYATNTTLGNSIIYDDGSKIGINTNSPSYTLEISGSFAATSKSFLIKHPIKEGKKLQHGVVEGPEHSVYVRGKINNNIITLPDYWEALVHEDTITVQLTPIGTNQALVVKSVSLKEIVIENKSKTAKNINCYYYIQGERKDIPKIDVEY